MVSLAFLASPPAHADIAAAEIRIEPTETGVMIEGVVIGFSAGSVHAELLIDKSGPAGTSNLKQGQHVEITRGSRAVIGRTGLSMQDGAELSVTMTVTSNGTEIATSQTQMRPFKGE